MKNTKRGFIDGGLLTLFVVNMTISSIYFGIYYNTKQSGFTSPPPKKTAYQWAVNNGVSIKESDIKCDRKVTKKFNMVQCKLDTIKIWCPVDTTSYDTKCVTKDRSDTTSTNPKAIFSR